MGTEGQLAVIAGEVRTCALCPLARGRTQAVPGEGHPLSDVLFVGEVHGQHRRSAGRFVWPMYQPTAALHQASLRETLFRDIRNLPAALLAAGEAIETERMAAVAVVVGSAPEAGSGAMVAPLTGTDSRPADDEQMTLF